jgi:hypothetical protein
MKLQNYALMAEIVGAFGIVLSLVFVGIQIKDNSDILAAQAVFDLRESNSLMSRDLITDHEFSDVIKRGYDDYELLTDLEKWRFEFWVTEVLTHRMTAWKYAEEGLLDAEEIETWQNSTCQILALPSARMVWERQEETWIRADFRASVERNCSEGTWAVPPPFRQ